MADTAETTLKAWAEQAEVRDQTTWEAVVKPLENKIGKQRNKPLRDIGKRMLKNLYVFAHEKNPDASFCPTDIVGLSNQDWRSLSPPELTPFMWLFYEGEGKPSVDCTNALKTVSGWISALKDAAADWKGLEAVEQKTLRGGLYSRLKSKTPPQGKVAPAMTQGAGTTAAAAEVQPPPKKVKMTSSPGGATRSKLLKTVPSEDELIIILLALLQYMEVPFGANANEFFNGLCLGKKGTGKSSMVAALFRLIARLQAQTPGEVLPGCNYSNRNVELVMPKLAKLLNNLRERGQLKPTSTQDEVKAVLTDAVLMSTCAAVFLLDDASDTTVHDVHDTDDVFRVLATRTRVADTQTYAVLDDPDEAEGVSTVSGDKVQVGILATGGGGVHENAKDEIANLRDKESALLIGHKSDQITSVLSFDELRVAFFLVTFGKNETVQSLAQVMGDSGNGESLAGHLAAKYGVLEYNGVVTDLASRGPELEFSWMLHIPGVDPEDEEKHGSLFLISGEVFRDEINVLHELAEDSRNGDNASQLVTKLHRQMKRGITRLGLWAD
jgi:hypothetical protein